jgi:hypothetical protein
MLHKSQNLGATADSLVLQGEEPNLKRGDRTRAASVEFDSPVEQIGDLGSPDGLPTDQLCKSYA